MTRVNHRRFRRRSPALWESLVVELAIGAALLWTLVH